MPKEFLYFVVGVSNGASFKTRSLNVIRDIYHLIRKSTSSWKEVFGYGSYLRRILEELNDIKLKAYILGTVKWKRILPEWISVITESEFLNSYSSYHIQCIVTLRNIMYIIYVGLCSNENLNFIKH